MVERWAVLIEKKVYVEASTELEAQEKALASLADKTSPESLIAWPDPDNSQDSMDALKELRAKPERTRSPPRPRANSWRHDG